MPRNYTRKSPEQVSIIRSQARKAVLKGMSQAQRKDAMKPAIEASPRTKKQALQGE